MKNIFLSFIALAFLLISADYSYGQKASKANTITTTSDTLTGYVAPKHKVESKRETDSKKELDIDPATTPPKEAIITEKKKK